MAETSKQVKVIAADPKLNIDYAERDKTLHKRVGAYCRVSTDSDEQINSYDQQVEEWTKRLSENPNYTLIKIYTDRGISGTSDKRRTGFQEMMADAKAGKLDMIFTKSISRFARNTALTLESIKKLKEWHVEVWFDSENMSSWDPKSEAMFAIMSTMAQEESRHISENVRWTFRKKMEEGYDFLTTSRFLGYDRDPETGELVINEQEAEVVRLIYDMYTAGYGPAAICRECEKRHYKTGAGKEKWIQSTIQSILRNEKYKGDLMLQKTVTMNYLDHKRVDNKGHAKKYYIENNHPPIVSKEQWDLAQKIIAKRRDLTFGPNKDASKYNSRHPMSGRLICVHCGNTFTRREWINGGDGLRYMYQCSRYIHANPGERCKSKPVSENILHIATCEVINKLCSKVSGDLFRRINKHINSCLGKLDYTKAINEKLVERDKLDKEISFYLEQKMRSRDENERYYLDGKYSLAMKDIADLDAELKELEKKQMANEDIQQRLKTINKVLNIDGLTPDMLTIDIADAFIYKIIIVGKRDAVFCINTTNTFSMQDFIDKRKDLALQEPIFSGIVNCQGTQRNDFLNYKVVSF